MEKICVAVRVRPFVSEESSNGALWNIEDNRVSLHLPRGTPVPGVSYAFDHVFDESYSNAAIYERLTKDLIHAAVEGFNGTVFAYGQTSSGKTFTMNGSDADPGIIRQAVRDVFNKIQMNSEREFLIRVSYMEIYNEEINDLFAVENQKLQIHESLERGIFVSGLREEIVNDADEVLKLIESGEVNRHFGETNMNARSSRSHTIFRMVIESKEKDTIIGGEKSASDAIRVSILNLVDLAGSERIAKTGVGGVRLKEGKHINKSLMILGNVINKLSEGGKQRGHIPYRDSKLTRILQPTLGGNVKTSIICTIAPEEVHIEETKGTLQFASRAKRIMNYAHVNEILTDAALLKQQKLEIEELRMKLEGSHAEVLEQEVLKLRNEMLKYEMEREKIEMKLEEERKSHVEREKCLKEQQLKIENLSSLINISDCERSSTQGQGFSEESFKKHFTDSNSITKGDAFGTPCFRAAPDSFVAKRSNYSKLEFSPLPHTLSSVVDEETWFKMNKGYSVDLHSIQMTPARKIQSFPLSDMSPGCKNEDYKQELFDLKRKLEAAVEEKNELERQNAEQVLLNQKLKQEMSELQQEAQFSREIPPTLSQCVSSCKGVYADVLSSMQNILSNGSSSSNKLLSSISEINNVLFSTLEKHLSTLMEDNTLRAGTNSPQEHCSSLLEKLNDAVAPLTSKASSIQEEHENRLFCCENKDCALGGELAIYDGNLVAGFDSIKQKFDDLEKQLGESNRLLEATKGKYFSLQKQVQDLKEERDSLLKSLSESTQRLSLATNQMENAVKDLDAEVQRRRYLEEEITQIGIAFAGRQKSLLSVHNEFKSKLEMLKADNSVSVTKSLWLISP